MGQTQTVTIHRTCDNCGKSINLVQPVTPEQVSRAGDWFLLTQEHFIDAQTLMPVSKLVCGKDCALAMIEKDGLAIPRAPEPPAPVNNVTEFRAPWSN